MSIQEFLFLLVVFFANVVEAMTGFAGTLLAMPTSMMLIGIYEAKAILNIIALVTCFIIALLNFKDIQKWELLKILFFMLIGMVMGVLIFEKLSIGYLLNIYAVIVISIAIKNLFFKKEIRTLPNLIYVVIIILAGIIHGMFLSGGSLLVIYAIIVLKDKGEFRATLAAVWVILDILLLINQIRLGYVDRGVVTLSLYALAPLFFAILLGNYLHRYIKQETFYKLTYILLLISGISLLIF